MRPKKRPSRATGGRLSVFAGCEYGWHRDHWKMTPREASQRSRAIKHRLLKQGLNARVITDGRLHNPFMTELARKVLINDVFRLEQVKRDLQLARRAA